MHGVTVSQNWIINVYQNEAVAMIYNLDEPKTISQHQKFAHHFISFHFITFRWWSVVIFPKRTNDTTPSGVAADIIKTRVVWSSRLLIKEVTI